MEMQELHFGHRRVCLYRLEQGSAPLVYSIDYHENGQLLQEELRPCHHAMSLGSKTFSL